MWYPIKLKSDPKYKGMKPSPGWYCFNSVTLAADPSTHHGGKQAAQKACDRRNSLEAEKATDGKKRNPQGWFTVGYVDSSSGLVSEAFHSNPTHYYGYLSDLLALSRRFLESEYITGAIAAVIWRGQLSRSEALHSPKAIPIHRVFADGRITDATA